MKIKILKTSEETRDKILEKISEDALKNDFITNKTKLFNAFIAREKEGTTGFEDGISMPHARIPSIKETIIYVVRNSKGVDWKSLDKKPTKFAIALLVPGGANAGNNHMELLSKVASALMDPEKRKIFKTGTIASLKKALISKETKETKQNNIKDKYDFVCISTCPTGVAHTNMAAEAMEKYAKQNNLNIKVERQGAQGPVNILTKEDIKKADYIVVAASRPADGLERFDGKKVYHCKVAEPIKSSEKVFSDAKEKAQIQKISRKTTLKKSMGSGGAKPMEALMNGISYMIPFVVCGGILIALSLGFGGKFTQKGVQVPEHSFWSSILSIGGAGFTLMIPILGGFIASAIAGRAAIAPAMIVSFLVGNQSDSFFNYQNWNFGVTNAKLGFLGAIAAGFLIGYLVKSWQQIIGVKMPKVLKPIEPIILIPIIITFVAWVFFAFAIYLPIYYLSQGLEKGITSLIDHNLFFIAAFLLGAMVGFDMGGPVNKIAFLFAGGLIASGKPQVMGCVAAAIAVPPLGMAIAVLISKLFRNKFDKDDEGNAISAFFMSLVGITEGAIPFAVKYPKSAIIANVLGSAVGAAVCSLFFIGDAAQHGGPIVWLVGAIGKVDENGKVITNYLYGLFYLASILIGACTTAVIMNFLMKVDLFKPFRKAFNRKK